MIHICIQEVNAEFYPMDIPYDKVFQVINENDIPISLVFISNITEGKRGIIL